MVVNWYSRSQARDLARLKLCLSLLYNLPPLQEPLHRLKDPSRKCRREIEGQKQSWGEERLSEEGWHK